MTPLELSVLHELVEKVDYELGDLLATDARGRSAALHVVHDFGNLIDLLEQRK